MFLGGGKLNYMEFSIATLLSHVSPEKLVTPKILEKKLGCETPSSVAQLDLALELLEKIGILVKEKGKFRRELTERIVEAKLRCSSKGFCFAIQDSESADDIYIRESHLSNAWNGDRVLIEVIKDGSRRRSPEGAVKLILERANPSVLAKVKRLETGDYRAIPLDDRLLFELEVNPSDNSSPPNGHEPIVLDDILDHLVHVDVLRHAIGQDLPIGKVARVLGMTTESAQDIDIVTCKHDLHQTFLPAVEAAAAKVTKGFKDPIAAKRLDLTGLPTIAIGQQSEPQDRALTIEHLDGDVWRLGVHIADIASYITADDRLDREARKRGTAVYLGENTIPLLPDAVHQACGFLPGAERLAISVFLSLNEGGELIEFNIQPSRIQLDWSIDPERVNAALAGEPGEIDPQALEIIKPIWNTIAPAFRAQRRSRGGLEVDTIQKQAPFADEGRLGAIFLDDPQSLLTDVMVMANYAIAVHLQALQVPGIYAVQHTPELVEVNDTIKLAINLGLSFEGEVETEISVADLQRLSLQFAQSPVPQVLNYLFKSLLKTTVYSTKPGTHFGLAIENGYTHAVSPLQRYPDILIQRVLHEVFANGRDRKTSRAKEILDLGSSSCHGQITWNVLTPTVQQELETQIAGSIAHLNDRTKIAQDAENDLAGLQKAEKMKSRTGEIFQGLITGVQSYGFFVEIEDSLVEGLVHVSSLKDDWYEFRPRYACLVGRKNRTSYRLGDRVEVQVKSVDYYRQQIDLVTVTSMLSEAATDAANEAGTAEAIAATTDTDTDLDAVTVSHDLEETDFESGDD
ncbi:ribonuclease R [Chamaesiphon sp. OTE_8_metabat_110]|uniref:ribonuclease R family protein n=1 Tax=Chamaesiphon sp. OTE_8_metabat_110 TaxID=2964696 RepID=UPI00286D2C28|nr:ribonuclease R [Chamaesiphon sp. OTE_8_metabat_110]